MKFISELHEASFFSIFSSNELHDILGISAYIVKEYTKGDIIKNEGDDVKSLGVVLKGTILVQKTLLSGKSAVISRINKGQTFGEAVLFSEKHKYPASVISVEDSVIFFLSKESIQNIFSFNPKFLSEYISLLSNRIMMLGKIIESNSYKSIREKIAHFLLSEYKERKVFLLSIPYTRAELADKLNIPRPSLSRELSIMQDLGMIEFHKSTFKITDLELLKQCLD